MRQVPNYLLIGNGRVSRHFQHYFSLLQIPYSTWHRQQPLAELQHKLETATHVLLLITDHAIEAFAEQYLKNYPALFIHFSGSLVSGKIFGAHPLFTFSPTLYDLAQYQTIPFILDHDAPAFDQLFPGLQNQHVRLHKNLKAKYHALCVLSGNFSCILWQKLFTTLEQEFHLPSSIALPYLRQQTLNLCADPASALTGPLVRGDEQTIIKNIDALNADPFQEVYQSFVDCYQHVRKPV